MLSHTSSARSRLRARSSPISRCRPSTAADVAVEPHPLGGEPAQVDITAAVAAGDVVVGVAPHALAQRMLVDRHVVVVQVVEPGDHITAAVETGHPGSAPDGEMGLATGEMQVLGDLRARLPAADDEHPAGR